MENTADGARGSGFDYRAGQIGHCLQRLVTVATIFWDCVAQALSRGDGSRYPLHISA